MNTSKLELCFAPEPTEHVCDQCEAKPFSTKRALKRHKVNSHQKDNTRYCTLCEKDIPLGYNNETWKLHQKRKHGGKVKCSCGATVSACRLGEHVCSTRKIRAPNSSFKASSPTVEIFRIFPDARGLVVCNFWVNNMEVQLLLSFELTWQVTALTENFKSSRNSNARCLRFSPVRNSYRL